MIYTFGYLGQSLAALQAWLVAHDGVLVDIRMVPRSRKPGWSGPALMKALTPQYVWIDALGNRNYKTQVPIEIKDMNEGLSILNKVVGKQNMVLLCGCREYNACHRHVVAEELRRRGHVVEELRLGGGA